ncbi:hypothetical protein [Pseudidiomarina salilacus]|uniref:hypothetical protein n=1 Tax=Pseudidiomarina salilacus TaxID=3384452 RepID=UPI0039848135
MKQDIVQTIHLQVERIEQLFNSLDPTPFVGRDLDPEAEDFITGWAEELPHKGAFRIKVTVTECSQLESARTRLQQAVKSYYLSRVEAQRLKLRQLFRNGRWSLLIGVCFLVACHLLSSYLELQFAADSLLGVLAHGLVIAGWVAMWRPIQIFLYDWWPLQRKRKLYLRLAAASVTIEMNSNG